MISKRLRTVFQIEYRILELEQKQKREILEFKRNALFLMNCFYTALAFTLYLLMRELGPSISSLLSHSDDSHGHHSLAS